MLELAMKNGFCELSLSEMMICEGGAWSWKAFAQSTGSGAVGGAIGGCLGGAVTVPVIGSVPGAVVIFWINMLVLLIFMKMVEVVFIMKMKICPF